jgi:hypothetical protein
MLLFHCFQYYVDSLSLQRAPSFVVESLPKHPPADVTTSGRDELRSLSTSNNKNEGLLGNQNHLQQLEITKSTKGPFFKV